MPLKGVKTLPGAGTVDHSQSQPFDLERALEYLDGDRELFRTLVEAFIEEASCQTKEIWDGLQRADARAVTRAAHTIKGSAGNFAAPRTVELAHRVEVLAREGRMEELRVAVADLAQALDSLTQALRRAAA